VAEKYSLFTKNKNVNQGHTPKNPNKKVIITTHAIPNDLNCHTKTK